MNVNKFLACMTLIYTALFWHWEAGINVLLFDGLLLLGLLRLRPDLGRQPSFRWAVALLLPAALSVALVHGRGSLIAHHLSLLVLVGYAQARELRFVWFGLLLGVYALLQAPRRMVAHYRQRSGGDERGSRMGRFVRLGAAPLVISLPFFALYCLGSPAFTDLADAMGDLLGQLFNFTHLPYAIVLSLLAVVIVYPVVRPGGPYGLVTTASGYGDRLVRTRHKLRFPCGTLALKSEYRRGVVTLALLNALLLVVNLTDLRYVWLATAGLPAATLSGYVHAGTYCLLMSIALAMGVVLYYFRGNLNFVNWGGGAQVLRKLTHLWLTQNALLTLSVGVRNWHYVREYGLAFGRVHIAFVLLLILVGLFTLYRKVKHRLSITYLLQANGMSLWLFLIAYGGINWPGVITRYNLTYPDERIDWAYLVRDLDDRNLPLLERAGARIPAATVPLLYRKRHRAAPFTDWRSWNYPDYRLSQRE
jgi:hypothetical protein